MAKKPSQKAIWKKAAKEARKRIRVLLSWETPTVKLDVVELNVLIRQDRRIKTAHGRSGVYKTEFETRIADLILRQGAVEWVSGRTLAMLIPNLKMAENDAGGKQYDDLAELFGQEWVHAKIKRTEVIRPGYHYITREYKQGDAAEEFEESDQTQIPETIWQYEFLLNEDDKNDTYKQLAWTEALNNKIRVDVGEITIRKKEGKLRKGQKKV